LHFSTGPFKKKIDSIVSDADKNEKAVINRLISGKVQLFDDHYIVHSDDTCKCETEKAA